MEVALVVGLLGAAIAVVLLAARERVRLRNLEAGQEYRDWIIDRASTVFADESTPANARAAAAIMLDCVYNRARLSDLAKHVGDFNGEYQPPLDFGDYEEFVQDGLNCLVWLSSLELTLEGRAFRRLLKFNNPILRTGLRRQLVVKSATFNSGSPLRSLESV